MAWLWGFGPLAVAAWLVLVWGGYWSGFVAAPVAAGLLCLAVALARERREARDLAVRGRAPRCNECGAAVPAGRAACPRCHSADVGPARRPRPDGGTVAAARTREREREASPRPQFVPAGPFWGAPAWYARGLLGFAPEDPGSPGEMRWWAARLLLLGGVFAAFGTVAEAARGSYDLHGAWLAGLPVLLAAGAASAMAARLGRPSA